MLTRLPERRVLLAVLVAVLGAAAVAVASWIEIGGGVPGRAGPYEATVRVPDASGVVRGADVQIAGVRVGRVDRTVATPAGSDLVLRIDARYAPLPADVRVALRTRTALGERYVGLSPGTPGGPTVPDRGRIRAGNVATLPTVGEVLATFDARTRRSVRRLAGTLRTALDGRGAGLGEALGALPDAADELGAIAALLDGRRDALQTLGRDGDRVLAATAGSGDDLRGLLRDARAVATESGRRAGALRRTVEGLPALTDELRATLRRAERLAIVARPTVRRLRTASAALPVAQDAAVDLLPAAAELLRTARPTIRRARRTLPEARAAVTAAGGALPPLRAVTRQVPPFFGLLSAFRREIVSWAAKLGGITQPTIEGPGGRRQHYIRLSAVLPNEALVGVSRRQPFHRSNPYPAPGALSALQGGVPRAFDCRTTQGGLTFPALGPAPPCVAQAPWTLDGTTASWPRLRPRP